MKLDDIRRDIDLLNDIDWEMTPEDAVMAYLEWGNNPALGKNVIRSKDDYSTYFVVNTWFDPVIYLIRRNSEEAVELAEIPLPEKIKADYLDAIGYTKGVYPVEGALRSWLEERLHLN